MPGMVPGTAMAAAAAGEAGDEVMIFTPVYPPFFTAPRDAERRTVVAVPLTEVGGTDDV